MAVFSNMIDISALIASIIFKVVNPNWQTIQKKHMRRIFMRALALTLAKPYMAVRSGVPRSAPAASLLSATSHESLTSPVLRESSPMPFVNVNPSKKSRSVPL